MNGDTAHSLYTTNDRGVNEVALRDISRRLLVSVHLCRIRRLITKGWLSKIQAILDNQATSAGTSRRMH